MAHAPRKIHDTNWRDYCTLVEPVPMIRAMFGDRPTIILCGHYGNFELSSYVLGLLGFHVHVIARPLDNAYLNRYLIRFREVSGQHIVAKDGSATVIDALMARGGTLGFLVDQHAGPKGCYVQFFGRPASTHKAIAVFALNYQAPLLFAFSRRLGKPLHVAVGSQAVTDPAQLPASEATVPALTQWFTSRLEEVVRVAPEQYWWVHRRWKDTREPKRAARRTAA
jgi:KDO2-lipid IV(A) lauroyltransferase